MNTQSTAVQAKAYVPPPSLTPYLLGEKFVNLVCGPVGSTKTTASIIKIIYEAQKVAPCHDGIRRSRCAVVRNTRQMLEDAFLPDFFKWLPPGQAGTWEASRMKFTLRFGDVECEVLFRGLDDAKDTRRLLSLQLTFGVMDEYREIDQAIFEALQMRLGRYPDQSMNGVGACDDEGNEVKKLWGATNPPDAGTFWEEYMNYPPDNANIFIQPSGLSPDADWRQYLPADYYENMMQGKSQNWIDVNIHAKFGKSLDGRPVYADFKREFHVAKQTLNPIRDMSYPLIIGMDFGLTPAATINQSDPWGRALTFAEITSENMGIVRFTEQKLLPLLRTARFAGIPILIIGDPAGTQRAQTDERTVVQVLRSYGFAVKTANTNALSRRIAAVELLLAGQVDGMGRHLIDPSCTMLIKGFLNGYRYKVDRKGNMEAKPEKNEFSHVHDAHQYAALEIAGPFLPEMASKLGVKNFVGAQRRKLVTRPAAGWT